MAFHVACPITSQRICFCKLGFPQKIQSEEAKKGFLEDVFRVEEFLRDPGSIKSNHKEVITTVQVVVPKVVRAPPPPSARSAVDGFGSGDGCDGNVGGDGQELLSLQAKRIELQKRAVAASIAAEEYARKFETGALELADNAGETVRDIVGEDRAVKVMCRICFDGESEGSEKANRMLPCKLCNKKYHRSCLKTWGHDRDLFHLSSWVCPSCRVCEVCRVTGDPTKFMFCKRCDGAYHCYCRPNQHKNVSIGPYLCPKHTRCHSCGSNVPGNGPSTRWFLGYTCCDACGRLFVKGNYCPVCLKVYRDSEPTPMVCCDVCERWVHKDCDGISDEKYQQFQADGNLYYKCAACRGACYQVKGLDDAVQELWKRRDIADRDQIASLRASAGLSSEEAFPASVFTDDDVSPDELKKESGRSLKFSVKGSAHKGAKSIKMSSKKYGSKKGYDKSSADQSYEQNDRRATEFSLGDEKNDDMQLYKRKGTVMFSPPSTRSPSKAREKCSVNQAGFMKEDFVEAGVSVNEARVPKVAEVKSSNSHGPAVGFGFEKHTPKLENVKSKKLVIHLGARNRNVNNSPRSEASSCHKDQDITASNGSGDTSQLKIKKKHAVEKKDGAARFDDGDKSAKTEQLKYSRGQEGSLMKLGKSKSEVLNLNPQSGKGNIIDGSTAVTKPRILLGRIKEESAAASERTAGTTALKTEEVPLRRHTKGLSVHNETRDNNTQKPPSSDSLPKDPKPLLKLKFKNPYVDNRSSWIPQEEEKSSHKRQRSKRKRPEKNQVKEDDEEEEEEEAEEGNTQVQPENPVNEVMDANWILKKLGKDAIGKRVEVHQASDSSWHKGEVTDMVEGTSTLVVLLDDGRARTLELGKQAIRFVSQKQKRSKT